LMLALMNDAPEDTAAKKPPVPSVDAFFPLVQLYMKPDSPDGVKAVALQGIARHVSLGAVKTQKARDGVTKLMDELIKSEPPAGRSASAHAFMQRYAVDILSVLASPNTNAGTAKTLVAISTDKKKPSMIAAYAAAKMSAIQPGKQKLEKLPTVLQDWAARAADTVDGEIVRINNLDPPLAVRDQPAMPVDDTVVKSMQNGGYGDMMDGGGETGMMMDMNTYGGSEAEMGGGEMGMNGMETGMTYGGSGMGAVIAAKPQPFEVISSRRRINHLLQQLQLGVTGHSLPGAPTKPSGLVAVADPADKATFDAWIETVSEVVTAVNADTLDDRKKFLEELAIQSEVLRKLSGVEVDPAAKPKVAAAANAIVDEFDPLGAPPMVAPAVAPAGAAAVNVQPGAGSARGPAPEVGPAAGAPAAASAAPAPAPGPAAPANLDAIDELN
jgi:hypothetical protein